MDAEPIHDPIDAIGLLAEPNRRRLYEYVRSRQGAVGRDEVAAALRMSRELAAFHLERLVKAGLLATEYRRLGGRSGPGAGRPAKLYRPAHAEISASLPPRRYRTVAEVWAEALERLPRDSALGAVSEVARERGRAEGLEALKDAGDPDSRRTRAPLLEVLTRAGYEPKTDDEGTIILQNCPYDALIAGHRPLTCSMNLAWAEGLLEGLGHPELSPELAPETGRCCVLVHQG